MSRTDKDRPWWVMVLQDKNYIDHDHRRGVCIEETPEYVRAYNGGSFHRWTHRECDKVVSVVEYCTKREPHTDWYGKPTCWTWRCTCDLPRGKRHVHSLFCENWVRVQCDGHTHRVRDESVACSCDDWPDVPTCSIEPADENRHRWFSGGVPSAFVRTVYHGPERTRERKLRDLAREYNAYGDLEDGDFFNRQGRNSARWDWW